MSKLSAYAQYLYSKINLNLKLPFCDKASLSLLLILLGHGWLTGALIRNSHLSPVQAKFVAEARMNLTNEQELGWVRVY